jgi:ElaB/YqjD/DUF883 family membrane-anchored ribosome-binding protein
MRHNGEREDTARRPEDILAEIDRTRHEMDYTLSAIEHRLTPGQLVDQGIDYLRHSGANEFVQNLGSQVKHNPLPVSLVGIGLAWLMAASKRQPDYDAAYGSSSYGRLGERAGEMKDKVSQGVQSMRERASGTAESASAKLGEMRERASSATQSAKERITAIGSSARSQMERARESADYMMREQPLALGAIGLAVGAFFAAMAPRTQKEDELMGEARDRLMDQAKAAGAEKLEQAKEAGKEKLEQARQSASSSMKPNESQPTRTAAGQASGKPTVRVPPGDVSTQSVPPPVGADLTPRGAGGTRGKP